MDTHFCFHKHVSEIVKSCKKKLGILRALAGTGWGCQKELILKTWKIHIEPSINYAVGIWSTNASDTAFNEVQKVKNTAARIATGCHSNTPVEHLSTESKLLPAKAHADMLSSQLLARALVPSHPSHAVVTAPSGPRPMKETLAHKHFSTVEPFLTNGVLPASEYKETKKKLHTNAVTASIAKLAEFKNPVIDEAPPAISESEKSLKRIDRTTLAQLRSGQCKYLNDYQVLTGRSTSALCPECLLHRHTARHIFNCDAIPTNLVPKDMWNNPTLVADFLHQLPSFSALLPAPAPPLPPPPPEPPP